MVSDIVFDFGNVLYQLDIDGCHERLANICKLSVDDFLSLLSPIIARYEKGEIGDENFIWHLQQYNQTINPRELVEAWNSMLVGVDLRIPKLLLDLSQDYNLYLLSNINGLHARHVDRHLSNVLKEPDFLNKYFNNYFYSHLIRLRKPDTEVYQYVSDKIPTSQGSLLFIDDNMDNVEAALEHGWIAQWHNPQLNIIDCIDGYLQER